MKETLSNSYIINDNDKRIELYFELCSKCGLHKFSDGFRSHDYKWPYVFVDVRYKVIQHAPFCEYIEDRQKLEYSDLKQLESKV